MRVCNVPGCPTLVQMPSRDGRCAVHTRTTSQRGYGSQHQRLRANWQARIDTGEVVICWRCETTRIHGKAWHLGHDDHDRTTYHGPECVPCNTATAGRA